MRACVRVHKEDICGQWVMEPTDALCVLGGAVHFLRLMVFPVANFFPLYCLMAAVACKHTVREATGIKKCCKW